MEFSRQEFWNGLPFPTPRDLPDPGIEPMYFFNSLPLCHLASPPVSALLQSKTQTTTRDVNEAILAHPAPANLPSGQEHTSQPDKSGTSDLDHQNCPDDSWTLQ